MTRYVCSWCGRKQEGVNLSVCEDCPGPLENCDLLREQQRHAREALRKAAIWKPVPEIPPVAPLNQASPVPLPPPNPRKPKPLKRRQDV